tara:strand:+ start:51818 stop:52210 length:393 start_codon:yes stop_codon:yes gene_type:complete
MLKKLSNFVTSISIMLLSGLTVLSAETLGERVNKVSEDVNAIGDFLMLLVGIVGIIVLLLAFMKLKANADDERQNNMKTVIIYFIVGAGLTAFSAIQLMLGNTVGEDVDQDRTGSGDFSANDLDGSGSGG